MASRWPAAGPPGGLADVGGQVGRDKGRDLREHGHAQVVPRLFEPGAAGEREPDQEDACRHGQGPQGTLPAKTPEEENPEGNPGGNADGGAHEGGERQEAGRYISPSNRAVKGAQRKGNVPGGWRSLGHLHRQQPEQHRGNETDLEGPSQVLCTGAEQGEQ